uniref:Uncharacterized protein n=1 Tax=Lotus japonicus TaxID=34305 RepID=I3SLL4_LOTJA|nr:unknown [Lotus japonicus]
MNFFLKRQYNKATTMTVEIPATNPSNMLYAEALLFFRGAGVVPGGEAPSNIAALQ